MRRSSSTRPAAWIREDVSYEVNEPDAFALEEALRQKEKHGGEVVVITSGPARAQQVLREALAKGADRAIHLEDNAFVGLDAFNTAKAFAAAIKDETFDLIFTGLQSDDYGYAQTGVILAELLGWPHATIIMQIEKTTAASGEARTRSRILPVRRHAAARGAHHSVRHQ
jgi:electron transfer flavoprotein beta subunit